MNRTELVRLGVLLEISDDYEEPQHIHDRLVDRLGVCKVAVTLEDIRRSLIDLVESGFAKAYRLGPGDGYEVQGLPPLDRFQDHYFRITDEGKRILANWRTEWPLDEEDELLPGWPPPAE
jgi:hypothetical protein